MNTVFFNEYIQTSPRFMTDFTPWTLFVDTGIISVLLLLGKLMRVKIRFIQRLFIPPSLLAGFIGLSLGPHGFGIIPLSTQTGTYAGILIAFIFGALPLISQKAAKRDADNIGSMWAYSQAGMLLQWAFGGLLGLLVLNRIWPFNPAFGITMPSGYCGGHGTAAAIGQAFSQFGYDEILTLAMTAATFGIVAAVIIGLIIIKWGTKKGHTSFLANYDDLPHELQTGLLPGDKRESMGESSCSSISIDPLTFNLIIVAVIALGGYCISKTVSHFMPGFELPVFSCAFVVGMFIKKIFEWLRKIKGFDKIIKHFEAKAEKNRDKINRGKQWGLLLFVAIPLPGTGGWTGALMASLLEIPPKKAFPIIALGVLIAGLIMTTVTYGIGWIVSGS